MQRSAIELNRPDGVCAATGSVIEPGTAYQAVLVDPGETGGDEPEPARRVCFTLDAWRGGARPGAPARVLAAWRATMPEPSEKQSLPVGDLRDVFEQLGESDAAAAVTLRYLIALVLMRKKELALERGEPGALVLAWREDRKASAGHDEASREAALVRVTDPGMDEAALAEASAQLGELIGLEGAA